MDEVLGKPCIFVDRHGHGCAYRESETTAHRMHHSDGVWCYTAVCHPFLAQPAQSTNDLFDRMERIRQKIADPRIAFSTALDGARWLAKHAEHALEHRQAGFRCRTCENMGLTEDLTWLAAVAWDSPALASHTCPPPLGNPTREEAIHSLRLIRGLLDAFDSISADPWFVRAAAINLVKRASEIIREVLP